MLLKMSCKQLWEANIYNKTMSLTKANDSHD